MKVYISANAWSDRDQRNIALNELRSRGCDWALIVDGDEVYTKPTLERIRKLCEAYDREGVKAAYFQSLTFVNGPWTYVKQEFPRLFKITPECRFIDDNFMNWDDMHWETQGWAWPHVVKNLDIKYHHYSFCKGIEKFEDKRNWWMNRGLGPNFDYGWNVDNSGSISDKNHQVFEYVGKHPKVMRNHPLLVNK